MTSFRDTNHYANDTVCSGTSARTVSARVGWAVEPALFRASHGALRLIHIQACLPQASA